jgi:GT2 family glycosyltransferase
VNDQSFMAEISTSDLRMDGPGPSVRALRALVAISPALDPTIETVVCIPCFRRPQYLRRTLDSLAAQRTNRRFAVVMVENDASKSESVPVAAEYLASGKFAGLCVIEPRQGNCHAINAAFETALQMFPMATSLLMIDDDEIASPDWLEQMIRTADSTGASIVGGPVFPEFDDERKRGLRRHPAFAPAYDTSGPVPVIYGCGNCLIRRSVFDRLGTPAFDLRFNFLGGGDTDFFYRCMRLGLRFHWVAEAVISESVPQSRTSLKWLVMRGLRIGAINYHVQRKATPTFWLRAKLTAKLLAALPLSFVYAVGTILTERERTIAMHPVTVAIGSLLAAFGLEPQPYKVSKIVS